jgi:hypothetical protein
MKAAAGLITCCYLGIRPGGMRSRSAVCSFLHNKEEKTRQETPKNLEASTKKERKLKAG